MAAKNKEITKQINAILKPIAEKGLRDKLRERYLEWFANGRHDHDDLFANLQRDVASYRDKMADFPEERVLFNAAQTEIYGKNHFNELDEFGYHIALIDRLQWLVFLRGMQIAQAGGLPKAQPGE